MKCRLHLFVIFTIFSFDAFSFHRSKNFRKKKFFEIEMKNLIEYLQYKNAFLRILVRIVC